MPKKILVSQRTKFWALYRGGHTIKEASQRAGFSESYGKGLVKKGRGDNSTEGSRPERFEKHDEAELKARPKRPHELSDIARDCLDDFGRWRARYCGSLSLPWQEEAAQIVLAHLESDEDSHGVINAPQGGGKTRLFSHDIPAWLTVRDRTIRGCLMSGTMPLAERMTGNLRTTFSRKMPARAAERWKKRGMAMDAVATLSQDYGRFRPSVPGVMWTRGEFSVEQFWTEEELADMAEYEGQGQDKESTWAAFSPDAQIMSLRFDFMECDDIHREKHLRNPDGMQDLFDWWDVEGESRLDPGGLLLVTMQRLGANDISHYLLDKIDPDFEIDANRPDDAPRQYFHVVFKAHYDDRCQGQHSTDAPAYPQGCMLDPKRLTWQKQNAKKTAGTYEVVFQQEDTDPATVLVSKVWVHGGIQAGVEYEGCWDTDRIEGEIPKFPAGSFLTRYMTVDPSPTKWWGIHDWLYVRPPGVTDLMGGFRCLIRTKKAKLGANEFLDWNVMENRYMGLADEWVTSARTQGLPISWLIMEKNAAQRWAMQYQFFNLWLQQNHISLVKHETESNKADPELGVWATLRSVYKHGLVRLPAGDMSSKLACSYLVQEVTTYPNTNIFDQGMSQWFGEYNLQHLVHLGQPVGSIYNDMPSWVKQMEVAGAIG